MKGIDKKLIWMKIYLKGGIIMLTLIKMDLKQRIKSPLTWFIIFILCMMSLLNILEKRETRLNRRFQEHDIYSWGSGNLYNWAKIVFDEREKELYPKQYYTAEILTKVPEEFTIANDANNIKEITRLLSFENLLWAKKGYVKNDPIMNTVFERKVIKMWNDVSGGISYEDIDFYPIFSGSADTESYSLLWAKYYHQLYINDFKPIYPDDINNITFLYDYFFNIAPKLIVIIPILLIYSIINKEKNTGSLKLILTQSISRWKYYMSKWVSGVIHIIFTILFPPIVISTILGFINGFVSMKYPTLYLKRTMTSFKPIPNYLEAVKMQWGYIPTFGDNTTFSHYAPGHKQVIDMVFPHSKIDLIHFYKYLLMVILLTILFIAFAVALTQLISAIIDKEIISFVVVSSVFALGILVSSPFKYENKLNLSPFTMEHASRIVIGTYNVTALGSMLILSISTILLLVIGCRYFKKKEI